MREIKGKNEKIGVGKENEKEGGEKRNIIIRGVELKKNG